jgi:mono/diheme cytochrome c family protein
VLVDASARAQFNRPALYAAIAQGRVGTEMPAWDKVLTPQEIANVAEFVFREFIRMDGAAPAAGEK